MTEIGAGFLHEERQLFPRSLGELLALYAKRKWPRDTAKHVNRAWDMDPSTATNVVKGHASERSLAKGLKAEGWPLFIALGEAIVGHSYQEHLGRMVQEAANVQQLHERHRAAVADLEDRAVKAGLVDRSRLRRMGR